MTWKPEIPLSPGFNEAQLLEWLDRTTRNLSLWSESVQPRLEGYGGIELSAPVSGLGLVTATPQKITVFDQAMLAVPIGVEQDVTNSLIRVNEPGKWIITVLLSGRVVPDSSNVTRTLVANGYNETTSQLMDSPFYSAIPRYGETFGITVTTMLEIKEEEIGVAVSMYAYTLGSTIDVTDIDAAELSIHRVGLP